ncbi:hypothetical protein Taro_013113 [Colocasia esculenta]|uniref:Uncharacterized protein n=1 Tax=Colocasia esculenta TaxID=4460 RepID=A0A843UAN0_COLES|nr:hypothetical protein [Colocasia esculenta]
MLPLIVGHVQCCRSNRCQEVRSFLALPSQEVPHSGQPRLPLPLFPSLRTPSSSGERHRFLAEMRGRDQHSRLLRDLCDLALGLLCSPAPPAGGPPLRASPAGFVSLLLGVSTTLMLSGSVAFAIGLLLMPWVIGMAAVLYILGALWDLSAVGRSIIFPAGPRAAGLADGGGVRRV